MRRLPSKPSHRHLPVRQLYVRRWRGRPGKKYIFYLIFSSVRYFSVRHPYPKQAKSSTTITIYIYTLTQHSVGRCTFRRRQESERGGDIETEESSRKKRKKKTGALYF